MSTNIWQERASVVLHPPLSLHSLHRCHLPFLVARYCKDCTKNKYFCESCVGTPHYKAKNQSHAVVDITTHLGSSTFAKPDTVAVAASCEEHGEPLEHYCTTCATTICIKCAAFAHGAHSKVSIAEAAAASAKAVGAAINSAASTEEQLAEGKAQLLAAKLQVRATASANREAFVTLARRLRQAIASAFDVVESKVNGSLQWKLGVSVTMNMPCHPNT
jgi:hypothetical protein